MGVLMGWQRGLRTLRCRHGEGDHLAAPDWTRLDWSRRGINGW